MGRREMNLECSFSFSFVVRALVVLELQNFI